MTNNRILVYGTGNWSAHLQASLPANCKIVAFVETKPQRKFCAGIEIIAANQMLEYFGHVDLIIVAVADEIAIKNIIYKFLGTLERVFFMKSCNPVRLISYEQHEYTLSALFGGEYYECLEKHLVQYAAYDVRGVTFLVNSKSNIMVETLTQGKTFQENDINIMFELSNKYYKFENSAGGGLRRYWSKYRDNQYMGKKTNRSNLAYYSV